MDGLRLYVVSSVDMSFRRPAEGEGCVKGYQITMVPFNLGKLFAVYNFIINNVNQRNQFIV